MVGYRIWSDGYWSKIFYSREAAEREADSMSITSGDDFWFEIVEENL